MVETPVKVAPASAQLEDLAAQVVKVGLEAKAALVVKAARAVTTLVPAASVGSAVSPRVVKCALICPWGRQTTSQRWRVIYSKLTQRASP